MGYYTWESGHRRSDCEHCGRSLTGRQERVCSPACRQALKRAAKRTREHLYGLDCPRCGDAFNPVNQHQKMCSDCARAEREAADEARWEAVCGLDGCEDNAGWMGDGRPRRYCSTAHKQKAYRLRRKVGS